MRKTIWTGVLLCSVAGGPPARGDGGDDGDKIAAPAALAPFEYLVGGWKGQGFSAKARLRGWPERHVWSWKFLKGKPVGMSVQATGSKYLGKGEFTFDEASKTYRLTGTDPEGKAVAYSGSIDDAGRMLTLERTKRPNDAGTDQIKLLLNDNKIRYTLRLFHQDADAPQASMVYEAGMNNENESLGGKGGASEGEKCIVTGGAAGMSVTYQGKSYPLCCTGCRDEFNENPEKYVKKMLLRMQKGDAAPVKSASSKAAPKEKMPSDDAKAPSPKARTTAKARTAKAKEKEKEESDDDEAPATTKKTASPASRAASILAQGKALEKAGNSSAALSYYKRIVKDFADTPSAKTATERIKALEK